MIRSTNKAQIRDSPKKMLKGQSTCPVPEIKVIADLGQIVKVKLTHITTEKTKMNV